MYLLNELKSQNQSRKTSKSLNKNTENETNLFDNWLR